MNQLLLKLVRWVKTALLLIFAAWTSIHVCELTMDLSTFPIWWTCIMVIQLLMLHLDIDMFVGNSLT